MFSNDLTTHCLFLLKTVGKKKKRLREMDSEMVGVGSAIKKKNGIAFLN